MRYVQRNFGVRDINLRLAARAILVRHGMTKEQAKNALRGKHMPSDPRDFNSFYFVLQTLRFGYKCGEYYGMPNPPRWELSEGK